MSIRWGFVGTGRIANKYLVEMRQVEDAEPIAVFARSREKAEAFADRYHLSFAFDSIDDFVRCPDIDIVYIAVTHPYHMYYAMKCMEAKKPVVCEKPMAPNVMQERAIIECAKKNDVFLMEAMWTRMFPITRQVVQWIDEGRIGKLIALNGIFSINGPDNEKDRLYVPEEAGGTLLDVGVYLISYSNMIFKNAPVEIASVAHMGRLGTDDTSGFLFKYPEGQIATLLASFKSEGKDTITIYGTEGIIEVFDSFWRPRSAKLTYRDGVIDFNCPEVADGSVYGTNVSFKGEGYHFEIRHVHQCLEKGLKESPLITHKQSIEIMQTCDKIREMWGLKYPFEQ